MAAPADNNHTLLWTWVINTLFTMNNQILKYKPKELYNSSYDKLSLSPVIPYISAKELYATTLKDVANTDLIEYVLVIWVRGYYGSHVLKYIEWVELIIIRFNFSKFSWACPSPLPIAFVCKVCFRGLNHTTPEKVH